jgi:hypothetical protein
MPSDESEVDATQAECFDEDLTAYFRVWQPIFRTTPLIFWTTRCYTQVEDVEDVADLGALTTTSRFEAYTYCPIENGVEFGSTFTAKSPSTTGGFFSGPVTGLENGPCARTKRSHAIDGWGVSLSVMRRYRR